MTPRRLVFTDMDGTLLDHHTYSFSPAVEQLQALSRAAIPVIPCTSKTRAELESLRTRLHNDHPFIVENGAAVYIPRGYFSRPPEGVDLRGDYWCRAFVPPRQQWLSLLRQLEPSFEGQFDSFARAGNAGVAEMTGLDPAAAARANEREFSEPVRWLGSDSERQRFLAALAAAGARALQGGRFLAVAGDCDKGRALKWLASAYRDDGGREVTTLAAGDSRNDCAMLEVADWALLVRSPVHDFPPLARRQGVIRSDAMGPAGWAEGIARWLEHDFAED